MTARIDVQYLIYAMTHVVRNHQVKADCDFAASMVFRFESAPFGPLPAPEAIRRMQDIERRYYDSGSAPVSAKTDQNNHAVAQ
jgi:hypothetical protein